MPFENLNLNPTTDELRAYYDAWDSYWIDHLIRDGWQGYKKIVNLVANIYELDLDTSIADIGCGPGPVGNMLSRHGYTKVDGYDISKTQLLQAEIDYRHIGLFDITHGPLLKKYNIITACGLFDDKHLDAKCAENIYNSLDNNGYLFTVMPDNGYFEKSGWANNAYFELVSQNKDSWQGYGDPKITDTYKYFVFTKRT